MLSIAARLDLLTPKLVRLSTENSVDGDGILAVGGGPGPGPGPGQEGSAAEPLLGRYRHHHRRHRRSPRRPAHYSRCPCRQGLGNAVDSASCSRSSNSWSLARCLAYGSHGHSLGHDSDPDVRSNDVGRKNTHCSMLVTEPEQQLNKSSRAGRPGSRWSAISPDVCGNAAPPG